MAKRDNGFDKSPERASEAGKKSKRGPSIKTTLAKILDSDAGNLKQLAAELGIDLDAKATVRDVFAATLIGRGLKGSEAAAKLALEHLEGKATQKIETEGDLNLSLSYSRRSPKKR